MKKFPPDPSPGERVKLLQCHDPHTTLKMGDEGTIISIDDLGTVHVKWDSGSTLGLTPDDYFIIHREW